MLRASELLREHDLGAGAPAAPTAPAALEASELLRQLKLGAAAPAAPAASAAPAVSAAAAYAAAASAAATAAAATQEPKLYEEPKSGVTHCGVCNLVLDVKTEFNMSGTLCTTLGCGHVVHQRCWMDRSLLLTKEELSELTKPDSKKPTERYRCPTCNAWNGPVGHEALPEVCIKDDSRPGHHKTLERAETWWAQPLCDLLHQVLGYLYQHHCLETTQREGTVQDEQTFVRRCKARCSKTRGGQQLNDDLEEMIQSLMAAKPNAIKPSADDYVTMSEIRPIVDLLTHSLLLHLVEIRKPTKPLQLKEAAAFRQWLVFFERWLRTAGLQDCEIEEARQRWEAQWPALKVKS